jgi:choline dehydrogenase-like flavoprotein
MQLNPETDWMYTADPGQAGLGLNGRRVPVPRGKMLGGSSSINYMMYVRGHPGDFDSWAQGGATGWSYDEVLPYFRKSEGLTVDGEVSIDAAAHSNDGPLGVSIQSPVLPAAADFVEAAVAAGIPRGDYNGRDRGGAAGSVSLTQYTTRRGRRSSTYHAFLEGAVEQRPNLTIITGAQATRVIFEGTPGPLTAKGVAYCDAAGENQAVHATKEVILSAGAIGSPHLLLLSGIGPRAELEAAGIPCLLDQPHVGKHLKDHLDVPLFFPAPGVGVSMNEVALSMGPSALRGPDGPLPVDPAGDAAKRLAPDAENILLLANPVLPHSEGEIVITSADPSVHPSIRMNYYDDPHDMKVMVAVVRRTLEIAAHWPGNRKIGPVMIPPFLAEKHGYEVGTDPSDALIEDMALHFSLTVYHHTCTCRIGDVVDPRLRVMGVGRLRVADASVMPNVTSGNTNAPSIMIGEKAGEMIAVDHGVRLRAFVGEPSASRSSP